MTCPKCKSEDFAILSISANGEARCSCNNCDNLFSLFGTFDIDSEPIPLFRQHITLNPNGW